MLLPWEEGLIQGKVEGLAEGKAEGKAKGLAQGKAETYLEIARKMKYAGRPFSEIERFTDLPSKTIEKL